MRPALDIRPGLHFCRFDGEFVLLDLPADRYFLVEGDIAQAFARFLNRCSSAADRAILFEQSLICPSPTAGTGGIAMPPTATASLIDRPLPKAQLLDTLSAILYQRRARTELRRQSFSEITHLFGKSNWKNPPGNTQSSILRTVAAFQRARRYVSSTDQCLARGIGLRQMLAKHGCEARLVFGVTLPFAAHCWVQIGETVLSDPLDVVLHYKPIFAA